jgi:hypothetical protein
MSSTSALVIRLTLKLPGTTRKRTLPNARLGANGLDSGHAGEPAALLAHPLAAKAAEVLVNQLRYLADPDTLIAEIGSHLSEGEAGAVRMGLTVEEGKGAVPGLLGRVG